MTKGSPTSPTAGQAGGKGFSGDCNHCGKPGHMKWQCAELDNIVNEKRAAAGAAGGNGKGKAAMELGNEWFLQAPAAGAPASGAAAAPVRVFWLFETAPQGPELPLIGNRFRELREDDAPV